MYARTYWVDHVTDQSGEVIQQGTLLDQAHFNNLEAGLSDQSLAAAFMRFRAIQESYELTDELHAVTLGTTGQKWPFNNTPVTVALSQLRESENYGVEVNVLEYSGGLLGHIKVIDRAANGFKLLHDGSAKSVKVSVRVSGGLIN